MLAFAVRGVVLLGVLSWYSTTVWRMIDGYFKDQFRVYLQDEYRRHSRMQADAFGSAGDVDKRSIPDVLPAEPSSNRGVEETYGPDAVTTDAPTRTRTTPSPSSSSSSCPADITDACRRLPSHGTSRKPLGEEMTGGTSENTAVRTDKNAFPKNAARSTLESRKPSSSGKHEGRRSGIINQDADHERKATERRGKIELASSTTSSRQQRKEGSGDRIKSIPSRRLSRQPSRKRKVNTIILTDADFAGARTSDDDFAEFEEDEEARGILKEGILVSELPFKPKADIGDLARVTAEEFCPLTPEDEASCGETTTWP